jgi:hypothetical protein
MEILIQEEIETQLLNDLIQVDGLDWVVLMSVRKDILRESLMEI